MSLYEQLLGSNKNAPLFSTLGGVDLSKVGRYRDIFLENSGDETLVCVLTRNGGGNRESQAEAISYMQGLPTYVSDEDDDFDSTYAIFKFKGENDWNREILRDIIKAYPDNAIHPMKRFKQMLDDLKNDRVTPDTTKAHEVGKGIADKMLKALDGKNGGVISV